MLDIDLPRHIAPDVLDRKLAEGWFRSGPVLLRADVLPIDERIHGLQHVRRPLGDEAPSRNQRKLLRRNRERFHCEIGPVEIRSAQRRLYEATKPRFTGFVCSRLSDLILGNPIVHVDRLECRVFDGERLVAASYMDVGRDSVASQLALHDPDYARFSLGFYTLLEEIEYARSTGRRYFYPGYVVPGLSTFDYKLRVGPLEYLDRAGRWRRRARPPRRLRHAEHQRGRLAALGRALAREGLAAERRFYPGFWLGHFHALAELTADYARHMVHYRCVDAREADEWVIVEYDGEADDYVMSRVRADDDIDFQEGMDPVEPADRSSEAHIAQPGVAEDGLNEFRALVYASQPLRSDSAAEIALAARRALA